MEENLANTNIIPPSNLFTLKEFEDILDKLILQGKFYETPFDKFENIFFTLKQLTNELVLNLLQIVG